MKPLVPLFLLLVLAAPASPADPPPPVFLSHLWIALDQPTYVARRTSAQVAALGAANAHATVAGSEHWSGSYWSARRTDIEFFGAAALPDSTLPGDCGIGPAVERRGGVAAVAERLRAVFGDRVVIDPQVRTTATGDIPCWRARRASSSTGRSPRGAGPRRRLSSRRP